MNFTINDFQKLRVLQFRRFWFDTAFIIGSTVGLVVSFATGEIGKSLKNKLDEIKNDMKTSNKKITAELGKISASNTKMVTKLEKIGNSNARIATKLEKIGNSNAGLVSELKKITKNQEKRLSYLEDKFFSK